MDQPKPMLTMSQIINKLAKKGIVKEFCMNKEGEMKLTNSEKNYEPKDLTVLKSYRFEGDSNPSDEAVLYVVKDGEDNRGMIIDSYGPESNYPGDRWDAFLREIPIEESEEYDFQH